MKLLLFLCAHIVLMQICLGMEPVKNIEISCGVSALAVSRDGNNIVAGYSDGKICVIRSPEGGGDQLIFQPIEKTITAIACGPSFFAVGYVSGEVRVFDYDNHELSSFCAHKDAICAIAIDDSWVATAAQDHLIKVFDLDRPNMAYQPCCLCAVKGPKQVRAFTLSRKQKMLFFDYDNVLNAYDVESCAPYACFCASNKFIAGCALHDVTLWVSSYDGYLRAWDLISKKCVKEFEIAKAFSSMYVSGDKSLLVGISEKVAACAYNCSSGTLLGIRSASNPYVQRSMLSGKYVVYYNDGEIEIKHIGKNIIPFKNGLDYPVKEIILTGQDKRNHRVAEYCKAHEFVRICIDFFLGNSNRYDLCVNILGGAQTDGAQKTIGSIVFDNLALSHAFRGMLLTKDIHTGELLLRTYAMQAGTSNLKWYTYMTKEPWFPGRIPDKKVGITAYQPGILLKELKLTDSAGNTVYAQQQNGAELISTHTEIAHTSAEQEEYLKTILYFNGIEQNGPYILRAETEEEKAEWSIPYLPEASELFIAGIPKLRQDIVLYDEFSQQQAYLPLIEKVQGSPKATLQGCC
jgi:hypothetical protein